MKQKYPIKLRGTAMEEFKIFEATLLNLFPCAAQRYRGSAHRARGLVLQKNPMCFFFNPSLRRCRSSVSPLYCCAIQGRRGEYPQRTEKIKRPFKATHLILSPCTVRRYRGSTRRAKGLNDQYKPADERLFSTPPSLRATSPIFCITKHRGGVLNVSDSENRNTP